MIEMVGILRKNFQVPVIFPFGKIVSKEEWLVLNLVVLSLSQKIHLIT